MGIVRSTEARHHAVMARRTLPSVVLTARVAVARVFAHGLKVDRVVMSSVVDRR